MCVSICRVDPLVALLACDTRSTVRDSLTGAPVDTRDFGRLRSLPRQLGAVEIGGGSSFAATHVRRAALEAARNAPEVTPELLAPHMRNVGRAGLLASVIARGPGGVHWGGMFSSLGGVPRFDSATEAPAVGVPNSHRRPAPDTAVRVAFFRKVWRELDAAGSGEADPLRRAHSKARAAADLIRYAARELADGCVSEEVDLALFVEGRPGLGRLRAPCDEVSSASLDDFVSLLNHGVVEDAPTTVADYLRRWPELLEIGRGQRTEGA